MKIVNAIIRRRAYEKIAEALAAIGVVGVTVADCKEYDNLTQQANSVLQDSKAQEDYNPKIELDVVVRDSRVDDVIELFASVMKEHHYGGGKVYIKKMDDAIRIRDDQHGDEVL